MWSVSKCPPSLKRKGLSSRLKSVSQPTFSQRHPPKQWYDGCSVSSSSLSARQWASLSTAFHSIQTNQIMISPTTAIQRPPVQANTEMKHLFDTLRSSQLLILESQERINQGETANSNDRVWVPFLNTLESVEAVETVENEAATATTTTFTNESSPQESVTPVKTKRKKILSPAAKRSQYLQTCIYRASQSSNPLNALTYIETAVNEGHKLPPKLLRAAFFRIENHPFEAYRILSMYNNAQGNQKRIQMYRHMCQLLQCLDPQIHPRHENQQLVHSILKEVQHMGEKAQTICFPVMVSSLTKQKTVSLGDLIRKLYHHVSTKLTVPAGFWEHLLSLSRYHRSHDLPYPEILERAVQAGRRPHPAVVLNVLNNYFPFNDTKGTYRLLQSIVKLVQLQKQQPGGREYKIDIATLELIGDASAGTGFYQMSLVVWDLLDLLGYEPTQAIYENTILAFLATPRTYINAFAVLSDMEQHPNMTPSRALIRGMSLQLRQSPGNVEAAFGALREASQNGSHVSVAALNAVMSGASEQGEVGTVMAIWDVMESNNIEPTTDTFSFVLESLGKQIVRANRSDAQKIFDESLRTADIFLDAMEKRSIAPSLHVIRDYVELLCLANEVETATSVVGQFVPYGLINNKIIYRVATANAELGDFDTARRIAAHAVEPMPFLERAIAKLEAQAHNEVQGNINVE